MVQAVRERPEVVRCYATHGPFQAVVDAHPPDHQGLLDVLAAINGVESQVASETLLDMGLDTLDQIGPTPEEGAAQHALVLLTEDKEEGCKLVHTLHAAALESHESVHDAYPVLGRFDTVAWLQTSSRAELEAGIRALEALEGVAGSLPLLSRQEAP